MVTESPLQLSCSASLAAYCASDSCDPTLTQAEQDAQLCEGLPAYELTCGDFQIVSKVQSIPNSNSTTREVSWSPS
jgi:hypothetical protein